MSLLKDLLKENDGAGAVAADPGQAISADSIANVPTRTFEKSATKKKSKKKSKKKASLISRLTIDESLGVNLGRPTFDASDVISRIDSAVKKTEKKKDTAVFGLEDENGNIVKVYVKHSQADDFEKALSSMLADEDYDSYEGNTEMEIAEVLFNLKNSFEIVNVEWPNIEGDKEEEQEVVNDGSAPEESENDTDQSPDDEGVDDLEDIDGEVDGGDEVTEPEVNSDELAKSALDKVIDMMKADAEAKKAEAEAREAEARAKEAEYAAQATAHKIRQEEQILDMEEKEKAKSEEDKEAKRLAKLAKYKYDKAQKAEVKLSSVGEGLEKRHPFDARLDAKNASEYVDDDYSERECDNKEESDEKHDNRISSKELSKLILNTLRGQ